MQHAVTLDRDKCRGCTTCIKQCPTEAIRVRMGKAHIISDRCIDCGRCIRVCPHHAKKAVYDSMSLLDQYTYTIALPAPSLYGQFHNLYDHHIVLYGLEKIGFDAVFEVAKGAEVISGQTILELQDSSRPRPVISSACPAVIRLICARFPKLIDHVSNLISPMEVSALLAKKEAVEKTGLPEEEIGAFFITPCPAKVTEIHSPQMLSASVVDGAFSMAEIYKKLLNPMMDVKETAKLPGINSFSLGWGGSGGEADALRQEKILAVDGIENVIRILEDIEDGIIYNVDFLELNACNQGCVGGCLAVENPYVAKARLKRLMKNLPQTPQFAREGQSVVSGLPICSDKVLEHNPVGQLDTDRIEAMKKYKQITELAAALPGLDCSSCGAPSCKALAEDIVLNKAREGDCIFRMREKMLGEIEEKDTDIYLPPPFRKPKEDVVEKGEEV